MSGLARRLVILLGAVLASTGGCTCQGPLAFQYADKARLSASPRPAAIVPATADRGSPRVAWIGKYRRHSRNGRQVEIEYRYAEVRGLRGLLDSAKWSEPLVVAADSLTETAESFVVRPWVPDVNLNFSDPVIDVPWTWVLWTGEASREGDRVVLSKPQKEIEVRLLR